MRGGARRVEQKTPRAAPAPARQPGNPARLDLSAAQHAVIDLRQTRLVEKAELRRLRRAGKRDLDRAVETATFLHDVGEARFGNDGNDRGANLGLAAYHHELHPQRHRTGKSRSVGTEADLIDEGDYIAVNGPISGGKPGREQDSGDGDDAGQEGRCEKSGAKQDRVHDESELRLDVRFQWRGQRSVVPSAT